MFAGWSWSNPRSKITYHKRCCCPTWVRRQINMEFAKVSRKYCNILFRQDGCFRGSTAELLCVTGDATACEQVAGAMPFLTSNRFQIEEIERERNIKSKHWKTVASESPWATQRFLYPLQSWRIMAETLAWRSLGWRSMLSWLNAAR